MDKTIKNITQELSIEKLADTITGQRPAMKKEGEAELAVRGECNNRRTSLYYFSCNTSLSASERKIRTKREET
ncbi:uncharacterized protein HKW66_Vig0043530 [Vigna angularis]|uniref:Uncharacterized protein n=1 Tax=Phaseolus angularis TaxID=3914 RepID=A0A8T0L1Y0_PHAAN|nr:uncharacterized protein HKW66_Vig0043530 [Vigna angularis]